MRLGWQLEVSFKLKKERVKKMSKKQTDLETIQKFIERWKDLPTEKILHRLNNGTIGEIGRKGYNEILKQRGHKK